MIPVTFAPKEVEPQAILFMSNHLGESLDNDQFYRGTAMAEELGMMVVAYERPETGSTSRRTFNLSVANRLSSSDYALAAAHTGEVLEAAVAESKKDLPRIFFGNCAGAVDAVAVTMSETTRVDYLAVADPTAIRSMGKLSFGFHWLAQQFKESQVEGQEPADVDDKISSLSKKDMIIRAVPEVIKYGDIWRSPMTFSNLRDVAMRQQFGHITVNVALMRQSFTATPRQATTITRVLDASPDRSSRPKPFVARVMPGRHSHFNDPSNRAAFVRETLALDQKAS